MTTGLCAVWGRGVGREELGSELVISHLEAVDRSPRKATGLFLWSPSLNVVTALCARARPLPDGAIQRQGHSRHAVCSSLLSPWDQAMGDHTLACPPGTESDVTASKSRSPLLSSSRVPGKDLASAFLAPSSSLPCSCVGTVPHPPRAQEDH
jgi:hypothetical protein